MKTSHYVHRLLVPVLTCILLHLLAVPAASGAQPPVERSLEFDGTYSNIVYHPVQPWMNTNVVHLTVETWVYARRLEGLQAMVARAQSTNLWFGLNSNRLRFARSGGTYVESTGAVPLRRWTHVAATYDGATARFYINGVLSGSAPLAHAGNNSTNRLSFGGQHDIVHLADLFAFGYPFDGLLDEVRLWATARSGTQIVAGMNKELRSGSYLLATFGSGGGREDLRSETGYTDGASHTLRVSGFGLLPASLCIPRTSQLLTADGTLDMLNEYDGAETIILRSPAVDAFDQPAHLVVATNSTNHDLFIGIPALPVGVGGVTPVVQIRGARDGIKGTAFTLGDWECRATEAGTRSGTIYRTNAFLPFPTWQSWPTSAPNWSAATAGAGEFLVNYEFRIHAPHLNEFTNAMRLLARYYNHDLTSDHYVAPPGGVPTQPATFLPVNWCDAVQSVRLFRYMFGSVSNVSAGAGAEGLVVSMFSGSSEFTGYFLGSAETGSDGRFQINHPSVPGDRPVTITYAPPGGGNITYLDPLAAQDESYHVVATNSPYSVTYPAALFDTDAWAYSRVDFRFQTGSPISVSSGGDTTVAGTIVLRTEPLYATPTNTVTVYGVNLHAGLRVFFRDPSCISDPPNLCTNPPMGSPALFVQAPIVSVAPDGTSLVVAVPSALEGVNILTKNYRVVVEDPHHVPTGGAQWNYGPTVTVQPPLWAQMHGFAFYNEDDHPGVEEFEACYGDSIFAYTPIPVRNPYYGLWSAVYFGWMEGAVGSCYGMAGTSRMLKEGTLVPGMFDTPEGDGTHGVIFANGFLAVSNDYAPKPAKWSGFDFFQAYRPLNVWGRIISFAGAQTSAEGISSSLSQLGRPHPFGPTRGLAAGDPLNVLNQVRANPEGFTLCIYQRDFGKGHCVTPYAVVDGMGLMADGLTPTNAPDFSLIKIYDNNKPGAEKLIEVDRAENSYRYNPYSFLPSDLERDTYLGRGLFLTPASIYRGPRHAPSPEMLASYGFEFTRMLLVGADAAAVTNAAGEQAGWTSTGLSNDYSGALPYVPVSYIPDAPDRWDSTMFFLPTSNAPVGGSFTSRGSNMLLYAALGWSDFAFGFRAPNTGVGNSLYGILTSTNQPLQGLGVRLGASVEGFSAMVSARDASQQCRVWTLDAGPGALTPDVHLSHEGFAALRVRNNGAAPLLYRVNLAGMDNGAGAFEFASEWISHPVGATIRLRTLPGRGFTRELDADSDGTPEVVDELPARGALRASKEAGLLALRWRQAASSETLEEAENLTDNIWQPAGTAVATEAPDRVARVEMNTPARFYRVKPAATNCYSLAVHPLGPQPNPWETNGFKFEAFNAFGGMQPFNEIVTRSGTIGLNVAHTVRIHPQDDCQVMHLDIRQTSGFVVVEAVGPLGSVVSRQELVGPGTGTQRVTVRSFRGRIHFVRVISANALCLIENICCERDAQNVVPQQPPSCLNFENMEPDFLNSPAQFGLIEITPAQGPVVIEPVPDLGVNGVQMAGNVAIQVNFSFGTCRRVTLRLRDPVGGALIQTYNISGFTLPDFAYTVASPDLQTIVLEPPGISEIRFTVPHSELHLLEFCCERDPFPFY